MPEKGTELAQLVPPSVDATSSFSNNGPRDGSDDARILRLSEIIVTEMRAAALPLPPAPQTIYRVPELLLAADKGAYQPTFMPLGPYHRGDSDSATEDMRRSQAGKPPNMALAMEMAGGGRPVAEFIEAIASMESEARSCYDGDVAMGWDAFCMMLLFDGFQLITLLGFLGVSNGDEPTEKTGGGDAAGGPTPKTGHVTSLQHDLMMLENQIPFFVVRKMYALLHADAGSGPIVKLAWGTISNIMGGLWPASNPPPPEFQHLVHLCHIYLKPSNLQESLGPCGDYGGRFRRATEYYEAGVKFRRLHNEQAPLLDVSFLNGVLRMARHRFDENTNYILRNVLAYEQSYIRTATSGYVTAYVVFMSQLLGSPEDVALLSRRGVIEHHLGNDAEVCDLFRRLAEGLVFDPSSEHYLNAVGVKLGEHCRSRLNRWGAWVLRHRLANPWLAVAWLFGAMAVLGTIIQTIIAVLEYAQR
ncbi:UPF0481 protein At3g47200-like [Triticum dicoccoides]|uniref:Uncharacterized protein n=2 Tax=Triticum TaxID=4564 RepID=A0A9R1Q5Y2_TRITD|nr:UPF0481 protein At3g47200-like [Triticum dicoccoides]XP_044346606.1 UPF0481 protein At3g47200-like isoform X2 [Triticum aestivum]VAH70665.1 unnamed protein product [Triticum turgidum subsp. durum]